MNPASRALEGAALGLLALVACGAVLTGCPEVQEPPETPAVEREVKPVEAAVRTETPTTAVPAATSTSARAPEDDEDDADEDEDEGRVEKTCDTKARWVGLSRCVHEGALYAVGSIAGVRDLGLARASAADRARRALLPGKGLLESSEVIGFVRCGRTSHALARTPKPAAARAEACDAERVAAPVAPPEGCPAFTTNVVRRDGDRVVAVGVARVKNAALAEGAAVNRARAEIARLYKTESTHKDGHGHSHAEGGGYVELGRQKAVCGGYTYVELTVRDLDG